MTGLFRVIVFILGMTSLAHSQVNVLTANYDNERTNANLNETVLNATNVNPNGFGKVGSFPVDGQIYAQPLYMSGVQVSGKGTRNVVFVVTMHDTVYAIDADAPQSSTPLWQVNLGPSVPSSLLDFTDVLPETGILGTPVIDPAKQVLYLVSDTLENNLPVFRIHALSLADGHEMMSGPAVITASVPGNGAASYFGTVTFDPLLQLQRPGLALSKGIVYICFGSHADGGDYHGWMFAYNASNLQAKPTVLNLSPKGSGASVWQSGRAPAIDNSGNLYAVTANGDFDGASNFGESVLKISPDLKVLDYYTPHNWADLNENDWDLGSVGAVLVGNANTVLTGDKSGLLYLVNGPMGHLSSTNTNTVHSAQVNSWGIFDLAVWDRQNSSTVYLMEPLGLFKAIQITGGQIKPTPQSEFDPILPTIYAGVALSANAGQGGSGIVWLTTGDYDSRLVPGTLHALDASDVSDELWNSDMSPDRDGLGRFAKFVAPTVANGRVYVATFSNTLDIYGLLAGAGVESSPPKLTAVTNGASFLGDAISPGEVLAIFGSNLGPAALTNLQMDDTSHVATTLSDTQVFFDGVSAPLLYTSANQLGAVVPFGTAGPTSTVTVQSQGQLSAPMHIPVRPATPALFSLDGTGGGQGAILNQDGSGNYSDNPAERGSIVVFYATGLGQTDPGGEDGKISTDSPLPSPVLSVSVVIDGQPAEVLFAGAAPGMVQGVMQINARVPATASSGDVQVVLKVGNYTSPSTVTLAVK